MAGLSFVHPSWVHLLWAALAVTALLVWLELRGRDALGRFLSETMQHRLSDRPALARRLLKLGLVLTAMVAGVLGLMRPQTPGGVEVLSTRRVSADIMVVLDVSRSMLAEDAAPNRLARAKAEIADLVDRLEGHRVGLVAFAGRATVLTPLTPDYGFFRLVLRKVDTNAVARGGSRIGEAIRKGVDAFGPGGQPKLLLLITDGEDHDSYPLDAAQKALEAGVRMVTIGFGSETGSEITLTDPETGAQSVLTDRDGNVVHSRLDGKLLRELALKTDGAYVPAGTAALDLESIVDAHVEPMVRQATDTLTRTVPVEHYRWFVMAALAALVAAVWVGSSSGRKKAA